MNVKDFPWVAFSFVAPYIFQYGPTLPKEEPLKDDRRLERLARLKVAYDEGYKRATGEGKRHEGAHLEGLDAVYVETICWANERPLRATAHELVARLERRLRM